jgi:hypothetical protein
MSIDQLQAVNKEQTTVYIPYIQLSKRNLLPYALSLYQKGVLEGYRKIESGNNIPFVATWNITTLPSDLIRCRMQFDRNPELTYEVMMTNFEFVSFLIELLENHKQYRCIDFSQSFYRKLLRTDY